ncbi:sodium:solute symporter, partial [Streptomyces sp. NPDC005970]
LDKGVLANEPIYYGLAVSLVAYTAVSLLTKATDSSVLASWHRRLAGESPEAAASDPAASDQATTPAAV